MRAAPRPTPATPIVPAFRAGRAAGPIALKPTGAPKPKPGPKPKAPAPHSARIERHEPTGITINTGTGVIVAPDGRTALVSQTASRYLAHLARGPATAHHLRSLTGREHSVDMIEMLLAKAKSDMAKAGVTLRNQGGLMTIVAC